VDELDNGVPGIVVTSDGGTIVLSIRFVSADGGLTDEFDGSIFVSSIRFVPAGGSERILSVMVSRGPEFVILIDSGNIIL